MATRNMKAALERYVGSPTHRRVVDLDAVSTGGRSNAGMQVVTWGDSSFQKYSPNLLLMVSQPTDPRGPLPINHYPFGASIVVSYADLLGALTMAHATDVHTRLPLLGTHVRFPT